MPSIEDLLETVSPDQKNILYLASGRPNSQIQSLSFENIVLVDRCLSNHRQGNVVCIKAECSDFLAKCIKSKARFDAVVIINEGLYEGGGLFPLHSDWFLGLLTCVVKDSYVHVAYPGYYSCPHLRNNFLDIPFTKSELQPSDNEHIDPRQFTNDERYGKRYGRESRVWKMERCTRSRPAAFGKLDCSVIHDSVWRHASHYDFVVLPHRLGPKIRYCDQFEVKEITSQLCDRILTIQESWARSDDQTPDFTSLKEVLEYARDSQCSRIAVLPWARGRYADAVNDLRQWDCRYPSVVHFYHLNAADFARLS